MPNIIHIVNGSCEINLDPMLLHEMPVKNWRKLVKLAAADWRNQESLQELKDWFSLAVQDAKVAWETASREFANGWKDPKYHGRRCIPENRWLTCAVKKAKRHYECLRKRQDILAEACHG